MKKQWRSFISALLAIAMALTVVMPMTSFGAVKVATNDQNQVRLLSALGVEVDTGKAIVTRADFAAYIYQAVRLADVAFNGEMPFEDVKSEDSYYTAIGVLYQLGVLSKSDRFNPNNIITAPEMAKMMVSALGYDFVAQEMGGFPYGYILCAQSLGISLDDATQLSGKVIPGILFEMLEAHPNRPFTSNQINIADTANGFLVYHNVRSVSGVITANTISSIYQDIRTVEEGYVSINGVSFAVSPDLTDGVRRIEDCLGSSIEAYVYDYNGEDEEILYFDTADNVYAQFNTADVNKNGFVLEVEEEGKMVKYYLSNRYSVIWNRKLRVDFTDADFETLDGTILLIDNNRDGNYDIVNIEKPEYMICDDVNALALSVSDKNKHTYGESADMKVRLDDTSNIYEYFINENGVLKPCTLNDLESYNSFAVIMSRDEEYVRLIGFSNEVSGTISEYSTEADGTVTIGEKTYEKTEYAGAHNRFVPIGSYVVAYLTPDNKLIYFDSSENNMRYGFLMKVTEYGSFGTYAMALLFEDGRKDYVYFNDTFMLDGNRVSIKSFEDRSSEVYAKLYPRLIKYSFDSNGKVACIDTEETIAQRFGVSIADKEEFFRTYYSANLEIDPKNSLLRHEDIVETSRTTSSYTTIFSPSLVPRTMKIFRVPPAVQTETSARTYDLDPDDFDMVSVGDVTSENNTKITVAVYDIAKNRDAGAMVYYATSADKGLGTTDRYSPVIVIDRIVNSINEDGIPVKKISFTSFSGTGITPAFETALLSEKAQEEYTTKGYDLKPGDMARIARSGNVITNIVPEIDYLDWACIAPEQDKKYFLTPQKFGEDFFCAKGKLIDFSDSVISILVDDNDLTDSIDNSGVIAFPVMNVSTLVRYNERTESFEKITAADLNTIYNSGFDNADRVVARCLQRDIRALAFYPAASN
ncbi:MAG: hypothetical protein E7409_03150 [Ruminococcaceae bacterium]|nr:hypothetical protein [Oscillospiraceae bacterium]